MLTVNLSLTSDQVHQVDTMVANLGYANRSEFFRSLLRLVLRKPEALAEADSLIFKSPDTKSAAKLLTSFKKTNKYSKEFLVDLEKGLKASSYFTK